MTRAPEPSLKPTSIPTLVVAALAGAAVAWLIISNLYSTMNSLPWLPAATFLALALVEFSLAQQTRARIERKPGRPRVDGLAVARYVVLAKASSLAGAIFVGISAGFAFWLLIDDRELAAVDRDLRTALFTLGTSLALTGAALWLERACRVPKSPDQGNSDPL